MGTETIPMLQIQPCFLYQLVKLNNPQMGTETSGIPKL